MRRDEEGSLAQGGMGWERSERETTRGLSEVVGLFGVGVALVGVVFVCSRMCS